MLSLSGDKIVFIADFFVEDGLLGGGELNNDEFCNLVTKTTIPLVKIKCSQVTEQFLYDNRSSNFIVSNFVQLNPRFRDLLSEHCNYVIYEHDHKYLKTRNPADYKDYIAPKDQIINYDFYKNAKAVFCQSEFHKQIVEKNLSLDNIVSLGGNLWSDESLNLLEKLADKPKEDKFSIMQSDNWHKNTADAVKFCNVKGFDFELIPSCSNKEFLNRLTNNEKFVFLPQTPETLSRIIVEARMAGMSVTTNKNVGASKEDWFKLKGKELVEKMRDKKAEILTKVLEAFDENTSDIQ